MIISYGSYTTDLLCSAICYFLSFYIVASQTFRPIVSTNTPPNSSGIHPYNYYIYVHVFITSCNNYIIIMLFTAVPSVKVSVKATAAVESTSVPTSAGKLAESTGTIDIACLN